MRTAIMILALTAIACESSPVLTVYHCTPYGCHETDLYDPAHSVSVCDGEDPVAVCEAFVEGAQSCWLDLYCDGEMATGCECVVIERRAADECS